jgi:hypothetical protein
MRQQQRITTRWANKIQRLSLSASLVLGTSLAVCPASLALAQDAGDSKKTRVSGIELENFSKTLGPGDDFFRYVNEKWLDNTDIPPDQSNYGAFTILAIETKAAIRTIIEEASKSENPSAIAKQVGDFYKSNPYPRAKR